jgi:hypothetical protein
MSVGAKKGQVWARLASGTCRLRHDQRWSRVLLSHTLDASRSD